MQLITAQVAGIDAWNRARSRRQDVADATAVSREMRQDLARRTEARRRTQEAVLNRADNHLRQSGKLLLSSPRCRAVLVHRNAWLREKVAAGLRDSGVQVVASLEDGADAIGTLVVEQPDIVFVEDRLPSVTGLQVVRQARRFAKGSVVAAHLLDGAQVDVFLGAGADVVFTRRISPADMVRELLGHTTGGPRAMTLV